MVPSRLDRDRSSAGLPKIVAFGDSLTAGLGVPSEESYPSELQRRLDLAGYRYRVINAGVSGDTTAGGVRRLDWVLKSQPGIVIVELGANDGLRGLNPNETRRNLEQIIRRLQSAGAMVVLTGMRLPPNYGADYAGRFASLYPDLAFRYRLALMPFFLEGVAARASLNQADGIHPTGAGYRVIVDHLLPILEPLLEKSRTQ
jgi:acyl-CoA thioesterase-1